MVTLFVSGLLAQHKQHTELTPKLHKKTMNVIAAAIKDLKPRPGAVAPTPFCVSRGVPAVGQKQLINIVLFPMQCGVGLNDDALACDLLELFDD